MIRFVLTLVLIVTGLNGQKLLIPMDQEQNDHLKAYGIAYYILTRNVNVEWLLNYRGGSFLVDDHPFIQAECRIRGVSFIQISDEIWRAIDDTTANYLFQIDGRDYIIYEDLKANLGNMFGSNYDLVLMGDNWEGNKPKDNILIGSDFLFSFDQKRVTIKTGFTFSFGSILNYNQNLKILITLEKEVYYKGRETFQNYEFESNYSFLTDYEFRISYLKNYLYKEIKFTLNSHY